MKAGIKRMLQENASEELRHIISATKEGRDLKDMHGRHYQDLLELVFANLARTVKKFPSDPSEIKKVMQESSIYKLANILKTAETWEDFQKQVIEKIPGYKAYPRATLSMGGIKWQTKFSVPEKRMPPERKKRSKEQMKYVSAQELKKEISQVMDHIHKKEAKMLKYVEDSFYGSESNTKKSLDKLESKIADLERENKRLKEDLLKTKNELGEIKKDLASHSHDTKTGQAIKKVPL